MFIAGIEFFFGLVAGALLLVLGVRLVLRLAFGTVLAVLRVEHFLDRIIEALTRSRTASFVVCFSGVSAIFYAVYLIASGVDERGLHASLLFVAGGVLAVYGFAFLRNGTVSNRNRTS